MNLTDLRSEIAQNNKDHPELPFCIYPNCPNKIKPAWDNQVLCHEHYLLVEFWFYEKDGWVKNPDTWDFPSGKKLPKPAGSDANMTTYRKRYCDWIASLSNAEYEKILLMQIGGN